MTRDKPRATYTGRMRNVQLSSFLIASGFLSNRKQSLSQVLAFESLQGVNLQFFSTLSFRIRSPS